MAQVPASGGELVGSLPGSSSGCHLSPLNLNTVKRSVVGQLARVAASLPRQVAGTKPPRHQTGPLYNDTMTRDSPRRVRGLPLGRKCGFCAPVCCSRFTFSTFLQVKLCTHATNISERGGRYPHADRQDTSHGSSQTPGPLVMPSASGSRSSHQGRRFWRPKGANVGSGSRDCEAR